LLEATKGKNENLIENRISGFEPRIFWTQTMKGTHYNEACIVTF